MSCRTFVDVAWTAGLPTRESAVLAADVAVRPTVSPTFAGEETPTSRRASESAKVVCQPGAELAEGQERASRLTGEVPLNAPSRLTLVPAA